MFSSGVGCGFSLGWPASIARTAGAGSTKDGRIPESGKPRSLHVHEGSGASDDDPDIAPDVAQAGKYRSTCRYCPVRHHQTPLVALVLLRYRNDVRAIGQVVRVHGEGAPSNALSISGATSVQTQTTCSTYPPRVSRAHVGTDITGWLSRCGSGTQRTKPLFRSLCVLVLSAASFTSANVAAQQVFKVANESPCAYQVTVYWNTHFPCAGITTKFTFSSTVTVPANAPVLTPYFTTQADTQITAAVVKNGGTIMSTWLCGTNSWSPASLANGCPPDTFHVQGSGTNNNRFNL